MTSTVLGAEDTDSREENKDACPPGADISVREKVKEMDHREGAMVVEGAKEDKKAWKRDRGREGDWENAVPGGR